MKIVMAVVNESHAADVAERLNERDFPVTRLGTSSWFMKKGAITLFTAVNDEEALLAVKIVKDYVEYQKVRALAEEDVEEYARASADIFILPVEEFARV